MCPASKSTVSHLHVSLKRPSKLSCDKLQIQMGGLNRRSHFHDLNWSSLSLFPLAQTQDRSSRAVRDQTWCWQSKLQLFVLGMSVDMVRRCS
jgi:hypothetical protein